MNNSEQLAKDIEKFLSLLKSKKESLEKKREECIKKLEELTEKTKNSVQFLSDYLLDRVDLKDFKKIEDSTRLLEDLVKAVKNKVKLDTVSEETIKIGDHDFFRIKLKEGTYASFELGLLVIQEKGGYELFDLELQKTVFKGMESFEELKRNINSYIRLYGEVR